MLPGFLLTLREGLEAALLVGITLGVLARLQRTNIRRFVWLGVAAAVALSLGVGLALQAAGAPLEGKAEHLFEAVTMVLAAGVLTWMILWMQRQGRQTSQALETEVRAAAIENQRWVLFLIAFTAVLREGVETALFLTAAAMTASSAAILAGAILGLTAAVALGWALYATTLRLNLRRFFQVTGALLMLFAAGLVGHAVHELNEAGVIPSVIEHVWDLNPVLHEASFLGESLRALFGYNGNPSLTEVLSYLAYFAVLGGVLHRMTRSSSSPIPAAES